MTMIDAVLQPSRAQPSMPPRDSQPVSADLDHMQVAATLITTDVSTSLASDLITTKRPSSLMREFPDNSTLLLKEQVIAARLSIALIVSAVALAGCSTIDNTRLAPIAVPLATPKVSGKPTSTIEPVRQFTRQQLDEMATKAGIAPIAGSAACDVAVYRLQYDTQGGRGEPVTSSAAVLVPQGTAEACTGRRPLVGYARGTAFVQDTDMAKPEHGEADAVAAATIFAAQGYAVVALNYVGYASSNADYHPYYELTSQARDMIDAIRATRVQAGALGLVEDGRLFLTGYSQGGAVVLATQRAIEDMIPADEKLTITAVASSAGAAMIGEMAEQVFAGQPSVGATGFFPLLINSYQRSYGNIYDQPTDVFAVPFDAIAQPGRLPGVESYGQLLASGKLPLALFDRGDGKPYLVNPAFQRKFNADSQHPFRRALERNNLNGWTPKAPLLLCHGRQDALVTFDNTQTVYADFKARGSAVRLIDLETQQGFLMALDAASRTGPRAARYHFVGMPFCQAAARAYFKDIQR